MRSMTSYLLVMLMVMFWIFRIVVTACSSFAIDIGFYPMDINIEIVLLFVTLISIGLVAKRTLIGSVIYLLSYGAYFGVDLYNKVIGIIDAQTTITNYGAVVVSFIGVVLPLAVFFNMLIDKNRTAHPVDKKTDWFYKNEEFDRKLDDRTDKNQYRNY